MLKDLRITRKLPLVMIAFALVSALASGLITYFSGSALLEDAARGKLAALLESRRNALVQYFEALDRDLAFHAQSPLMMGALTEFSDATGTLGGSPARRLQALYIHRNPYAVGSKDALLDAADGSAWSAVHARLHPALRALADTRGIYDVFLIAPDGRIVYTVRKEADLGSSLVDGPWHDSGLGDVFRAVTDNPQPGRHAFADFARYGPSDDTPAGFLAAAVFDDRARLLGVLAFQMPIGELNAVMQVTAGMGETGETYVVGADRLMRSDSRFMTGHSILETRVDTPSVTAALDGLSGTQTIDDYRGIPVLSAYAPIEFRGTRWAVLAEVDEAEVLAPVLAMTRSLLGISALLAGGIALVGFVLASDIAHPIVAMTRMMKRLARNDLSVNISVSERRDEVGSMAGAMVVFKRNAIERDALQQRLSHMVNHDALTGLPARQYALDRLQALLDERRDGGQPFAVMFVDLDNFKSINDDLGHDVGDQVLHEAARRLTAAVRKGDLVARFGGDEFFIVLPDIVGPDDASRVTDKIEASLARPLAFLPAGTTLRASIGAAVHPTHGADVATLVRAADQAMYSRKRARREQAGDAAAGAG